MSRLRSIANWFCVAMLAAALFVVAASMVDTRVWWMELPAHFRVQAFWAFSVLGLALLAVATVRRFLADKRPKRCSLQRLISTLVALGVALNGYGSFCADAPGIGLLDGGGSGATRITVVHLNLGTRGGDWSNVVAWLQTQPADVVFLQEARPDFERALNASPLASNVVLRNVRDDSRGTIALVLGDAVLVSANLDAETFKQTGREMASITIDKGRDRRTLLSMHMCRPTNATEFAKQSYEIGQLGKWFVSHHDGIAVGDINCSVYSPRLGAMLKRGRLRATTNGTWPTPLPSLVSAGIDVLVTDRSTAIVSATTGPDLGSDHLPLIVTVRLSS